MKSTAVKPGCRFWFGLNGGVSAAIMGAEQKAAGNGQVHLGRKIHLDLAEERLSATVRNPGPGRFFLALPLSATYIY